MSQEGPVSYQIERRQAEDVITPKRGLQRIGSKALLDVTLRPGSKNSASGSDRSSRVDTREMLSPRTKPPTLCRLKDLRYLTPMTEERALDMFLSRITRYTAPKVKESIDFGPCPWEPGGEGETSGPKRDKNRSLYFDVTMCSHAVRLSPDCASASIRGKEFGGFAISEQRLKRTKIGRWFELRIEETDNTRWMQGLGVGFCEAPSEEEILRDGDGHFQGLLCDQMTRCWMVGYDGRAKLPTGTRLLIGSELPHGTWRPNELRPDDIIGVCATRDGSMLFYVNDVLRYAVRKCGIPWSEDLYVALDLDGCTQSVRLLDSNGAPRPSTEQSLALTTRALSSGLSLNTKKPLTPLVHRQV